MTDFANGFDTAPSPVVESASASTAYQTTSSRKAYAICAGVLAVIALIVLAFIGLVYTGLTTYAAIESNSESVRISIGDYMYGQADDGDWETLPWDETWESEAAQ